MSNRQLICWGCLAGALLALLPYIVSVIVSVLALTMCLYILAPMVEAYFRYYRP